MRPNAVIPSILFGLKIEVDNPIESNTLVVELNTVWYTISFGEIKPFKQLVEVQKKSITQDKASPEFMQFIQWP